MLIKLKATFDDPLLLAMNFLSEVTLDYPDAISFATGSPMESFFGVDNCIRALNRFIDIQASITNTPYLSVINAMGQYNRTNGIINDFIAQHLANDENIIVEPEAVMITSGSQEAMIILMAGLFDPSTDVLLISSPTYIGITGLARILGVQVVAVPSSEDGLDLNAVSTALQEVVQSGKRPRALYDVPDFNNPLGTSMPITTRYALLKLAKEYDMFIFEDNPYGMFCYDGERLPTLKSLDEDGVVIYLGTFSKTIFPGLRIGYLVGDQLVDGRHCLLAEELSKIKGFTTVNTSPLLQAMVGGLLLDNNGSLQPLVENKLQFYKENRDRMVARLDEEFNKAEFKGTVRWNRPSGGFFLTMKLPFLFDKQCFQICANKYGILCLPITFFLPEQRPDNRIRLSFSYVTAEQIDEGIRRLGRFVREHLSEVTHG